MAVKECPMCGETMRLRERVRRADPSTVHVVTSGFGLTGPYRNWKRSSLTDWVAGGHAYLTGLPDREPLQGGGPWASYVTGQTAAIGAQAALLHAVRTGEGQLVDVSAIESMAALHQWTITMYTHTGCIKGRWGNRFAESVHPIALYECSDGWISIVAPSYPSFEALCLVIDAPELLLEPAFEANAVRFDRANEIDPYITAWTQQRTCDEAVSLDLKLADAAEGGVHACLHVLECPNLGHGQVADDSRHTTQVDGLTLTETHIDDDGVQFLGDLSDER